MKNLLLTIVDHNKTNLTILSELSTKLMEFSCMITETQHIVTTLIDQQEKLIDTLNKYLDDEEDTLNNN